MNFYGKISGPQHTIFGRVAPMVDAMRLAICRAGNQPLPPPQYTLTLPAWGHNIANEITCTVFKGIVNLAPQGKKYHARNTGQIVGLLIRMGIFYWKDAQAIIEREGLTKLTPEQEQKLEKLAGWEVAMAQASRLAGHPIKTKAQLITFVMQRVSKLVLHTTRGIWLMVKFALCQPVGDVGDFFVGLAGGFKCFLDTAGNFAKTGKRTEVFFALLAYWPEIEEMRQAQPPLGKPYVMAWLEKQEGKQLMTSAHAFSELCTDIGLDFGLNGHPFNRPELQG